MILTDGSEEMMQGIIRGIEALDKDHQIGIIYGQYETSIVSEAEHLLASLANATIVHTPNIVYDEPVNSYVLDIPEELDNRETIISYIKDKYPNLIKDLLK